MSDVAACIVSFNPESDKLQANIRAIAPQVGHVYIVDNGSNNLQEIK